MENASKALIMAAEILVGVMILSIGVYLFQHFASYSAENYQKMEDVQIAEFNNKFLKFYGDTTTNVNNKTVTVPVQATIHDVTGLANFAQKNNLQNQVQDNSGGAPNCLYVQIDVDGIGRNLEKKSNTDLIKYIQNNSLTSDNKTKYYRCIQCLIDDSEDGTKRVYYVKFREFNDNEYMQIRQIEEI